MSKKFSTSKAFEILASDFWFDPKFLDQNYTHDLKPDRAWSDDSIAAQARSIE